MDIGYISDPVPEFCKPIASLKSLEELRAHIANFELIAWDAKAAADAMAENDWPEFQKGLRSERKGKFAGEYWLSKYGAIAMPELMFRVSVIAVRFGAPWGCAYIRSRDEGYITEVDGRAKWVQLESTAVERQRAERQGGFDRPSAFDQFDQGGAE